jgi:hypothetical protein
VITIWDNRFLSATNEQLEKFGTEHGTQHIRNTTLQLLKQLREAGSYRPRLYRLPARHIGPPQRQRESLQCASPGSRLYQCIERQNWSIRRLGLLFLEQGIKDADRNTKIVSLHAHSSGYLIVPNRSYRFAEYKPGIALETSRLGPKRG